MHITSEGLHRVAEVESNSCDAWASADIPRERRIRPKLFDSLVLMAYYWSFLQIGPRYASGAW